jgi:hypothetical protein
MTFILSKGNQDFIKLSKNSLERKKTCQFKNDIDVKILWRRIIKRNLNETL